MYNGHMVENDRKHVDDGTNDRGDKYNTTRKVTTSTTKSHTDTSQTATDHKHQINTRVLQPPILVLRHLQPPHIVSTSMPRESIAFLFISHREIGKTAITAKSDIVTVCLYTFFTVLLNLLFRDI
jgi:hypothetical protein